MMSRKLQALNAAAASSGWLFAIVRIARQQVSRKLLGPSVPLESLAEAQNATRSAFAALNMAEQLRSRCRASGADYFMHAMMNGR